MKKNEKMRATQQSGVFFNIKKTLKRHVLSILVQAVTIIVVAKFYGPEGNGIYALVLLLPLTLAGFLSLGFESSNVYFLSRKQFNINTAFYSNVLFGFIVSVSGLGLGSMVLAGNTELFFPKINSSLLWVSLISFPAILMQKLLASILQGLQKFDQFNIALLAYPCCLFLFIIVIVLFKLDNIAYLIAASSFSAYMSLAVTFFLVRAKLISEKPVNVRKYILRAINYGYKVHASNILSHINYKADLFLLNILMNPLSAGVYVVAVQISERLWLVSQAISTVLFPKLSSMSGDEFGRKEVTAVLFRIVFYITMIGSVVLSISSWVIVELLFGVEYIGAVIPLLVLQPGVVALAVSRLIANDTAARGRPELNAYSSVIVVVVNVIANILLIPVFGLTGAALATSLAYVANLIFRLAVYKMLTNCELRVFWVPQMQDLIHLRYLFGPQPRSSS